jgi:hypothetical protein
MSSGFVTTFSEAEDLAVGWMRDHGYPDARHTKGGADGGIDVQSSEGIAQVKFEAHQTGRPALQRLVGASRRGGQDLLFFTATGYSRAAVDYADDMDIALFTYDVTGVVTAENSPAVAIMRSTSDGTAASSESLENVGKIFAGFGWLILANMVFQTGRYLAGSGYPTWDWWDVLWVAPLGLAFVWLGRRIRRKGQPAQEPDKKQPPPDSEPDFGADDYGTPAT